VLYIFYNPAAKIINIHCPGYKKPQSEDTQIIDRIFDSFARMRKTQNDIGSLYKPSSVWQEQLDVTYEPLIRGFRENNKELFHHFLANFGTWKKYTGVEHSARIHKQARSLLGRLYLQNMVFYRKLKAWQWYYDNRKPIQDLSYPQHGNQAGAYIKRNFVGIGSFFNEVNGSQLAGLVSDKPRPIIAELGAGYGKLAYFILRDKGSFSYIDFDLPEVVCLAAYFFMKSFPQKKVLLYGEDEYKPGKHKEYDFIFMPCWEIEHLGDASVDLFLNKNSLGEMDRKAAENYIGHITRSTYYFFHMNHDIRRVQFKEGSGLLGYEYPISEEDFILLCRYPSLGHIIDQGFIDLNQDIFAYLYKKRSISEQQ
jgi:putative sugar O-methyltransferase